MRINFLYTHISYSISSNNIKVNIKLADKKSVQLGLKIIWLKTAHIQ